MSDIQIKVFDDSIRIWNPGVLSYDLRFEQLREGTYSSKPRNKLIAQIFYDLEIIERYGCGIGRIDDACKEAGLPTPKIENQAGGFTVIFSKASAGEGTPPVTGEVTGEVTSEVLQFLRVRAHGPLTRADAQEELGLKGQANSRDRYLGPASDAGLIEMTIPDKPRSSRQKYRLTGSIAGAQ